MRRIQATFACRLLALLTAIVIGMTSSAVAESGNQETTPSLGTLSRSGLRLTVDDRWVGNRGYMPARCTLRASKPATTDREYLVTCTLHSSFGYRPAVAASKALRIPAGAVTGSTTIYVPRICASENYLYTVSRNGRNIQELTQNRYGYNSGGYTENIPSVLVVGAPAKVPNVSRLFDEYELVTGADSSYPVMEATGLDGEAVRLSNTQLSRQSRFLGFVSMDQLPSDWLPYTAADLILVSWAQLEQLQKDRPEVLAALNQWNRAGGNLVIYGPPSDDGDSWWINPPSATTPRDEIPPPLGKVEQLLSMPPSRQWAGPLETDWHPAKPSSISYRVRGLPQSEYGTPSAYSVEDESMIALTKSEIRDRLGQLANQSPFAWRAHEFGTVLVIYEANIGELPQPFWGWCLNSLGTGKWSWRDRHAVTYVAQNRHFRNLLIPGVGVAPTTAFQVLITAFVILIGPVNFYFAARTKRMHYLLVTIPLAAALICVSLFAYAVLADGLGIRQRARSLTLLNQDNGQATTWARLSYYAGLAPGDGLRFSANTAVYPLPPDIDEYSNARQMTWSDRQRLTDNWLPSRTPIQYVTIKPEKTSAGLHLSNNGEAANVTNNLGELVNEAVLRDEAGKFWLVEQLDVDSTTQAMPLTDDEAHARLLDAYRASRLKIESSDDQGRGGIFGIGSSYRYYYDNYEAIGDGSSRLEQQIGTALRKPKAKTGSRRDLPPRSYFAIMASNPFLEPGHASAQEELSTHYILGNW